MSTLIYFASNRDFPLHITRPVFGWEQAADTCNSWEPKLRQSGWVRCVSTCCLSLFNDDGSDWLQNNWLLLEALQCLEKYFFCLHVSGYGMIVFWSNMKKNNSPNYVVFNLKKSSYLIFLSSKRIMGSLNSFLYVVSTTVILFRAAAQLS